MVQQKSKKKNSTRKNVTKKSATKKKIEKYKEGVKNGDADAQYNLGRIFEFGKGVRRNYGLSVIH
jgi:TPR repeat protein